MFFRFHAVAEPKPKVWRFLTHGTSCIDWNRALFITVGRVERTQCGFFTINKLELRIEAAKGNKDAERVLSLRRNGNFLLVSILRLPFVNGRPIFPDIRGGVSDEFLSRDCRSGRKWIVLADMEDVPGMVLD